MIDLKAVEVELHNARQARINAELACCDVEELTEEIRQSHHAFRRLMGRLHEARVRLMAPARRRDFESVIAVGPIPCCAPVPVPCSFPVPAAGIPA